MLFGVNKVGIVKGWVYRYNKISQRRDGSLQFNQRSFNLMMLTKQERVK